MMHHFKRRDYSQYNFEENTVMLCYRLLICLLFCSKFVNLLMFLENDWFEEDAHTKCSPKFVSSPGSVDPFLFNF